MSSHLATSLRETCSQVAKKHFAESWQKGRVEFLPVEWRTWLSLDKGQLMKEHHVTYLMAGMDW